MKTEEEENFKPWLLMPDMTSNCVLTKAFLFNLETRS